jgi:hypothetical protein
MGNIQRLDLPHTPRHYHRTSAAAAGRIVQRDRAVAQAQEHNNHPRADLAVKEKTLARLESPDSTMRRYRAPDSLMPFLQWLKLCKECAGS